MNPLLPSFLFKLMSKAFFVLFLLWIYKHNLGFTIAALLCYGATRFLSGYYRYVGLKRIRELFEKHFLTK